MTDAEWLRQEADGFDSKYAPTDAKAKRLQAVLRRAADALDLLLECRAELREHGAEYQHVTKDGLLARIDATLEAK